MEVICWERKGSPGMVDGSTVFFCPVFLVDGLQFFPSQHRIGNFDL